jgi:hypothetical protein
MQIPLTPNVILLLLLLLRVGHVEGAEVAAAQT